MSRILISVQRRIESAQRARYDAAWSAFRRVALAHEAKAWRFRSPGDEALHLEFLEFRADADPRSLDDVRAAMQELESVATGRLEKWEDANLQ